MKLSGLFIAVFAFALCSQAQQNDSLAFVSLRSGETVYFDQVSMSKGKVVGVNAGVTTSYEKSECKDALLAEMKKGKWVINKHVVFASAKLRFNMGGKGPFDPGEEEYNVVVKNGEDMIIYKPNIVGLGGGMGGSQTTYLHVMDGIVSKIEVTEWRNDTYMQSFVDDFGLCPETKQALKDFKTSGDGARQIKYDFFMQSLEKKYLQCFLE